MELSETEMTEFPDLTGERKTGPAIRRLMQEALPQRQRARIAQCFLSGARGLELDSTEALEPPRLIPTALDINSLPALP